MKRMPKYLISIWRNGDPDAETECVAFPPDVWGSVTADVELLTDDLKDLQADGLIDSFTVTEQPSQEIDKTELLKWLDQIRQEQE